MIVAWILVGFIVAFGVWIIHRSYALERATSEVSIEDASWVLNCSTEYVEALVCNGELKLTAADLLRYHVKRQKERHQALLELTQESQLLGLYDNED